MRDLPKVCRHLHLPVQSGSTRVLTAMRRRYTREYYLDLVRETRRRFPDVLPHFFTASEIQTMARVSTLSVREVLERLRDAGQRTLPGGGAEILSERVRLRIAPKKGGPASWLEVHREAHRLGFR